MRQEFSLIARASTNTQYKAALLMTRYPIWSLADTGSSPITFPAMDDWEGGVSLVLQGRPMTSSPCEVATHSRIELHLIIRVLWLRSLSPWSVLFSISASYHPTQVTKPTVNPRPLVTNEGARIVNGPSGGSAPSDEPPLISTTTASRTDWVPATGTFSGS